MRFRIKKIFCHSNFLLHIFYSAFLNKGMDKSKVMLVSMLHFTKDFRFLLILIKMCELVNKKSLVNIHCMVMKRIIFRSKFKLFLFEGFLIFSLLAHSLKFFIDFFFLFLKIFLLRSLLDRFCGFNNDFC